MNELIKAALIRAERSIFQSMASNLPAGLVITPMMIQAFDINVLYIVGAYIATALFHGFAAFVTAIATGLPEADYATYLHMDVPEPDDAEVDEYEDED